MDADTLVNARTLRATVAAIERGAVGGRALLDFDGPLPAVGRVMAAALALGMRVWGLAALNADVTGPEEPA